MEMSAEQLCTYKQTGRQPHRHAELIKAWADGAEIQVFIKDGLHGESYWRDILNPNWDGKTYRIKPKALKYRNYLWKNPWNNNQYYIGITREENKKYSTNFIKWLGDWQEVEV